MDYTERAAYLATLAEQSEDNAERLAEIALASASDVRAAWEAEHGYNRDSFETFRTGYNQYAAAVAEDGYNVTYDTVDGNTVAVVKDTDGHIIDEDTFRQNTGYTFSDAIQY